MSGKKMTIAQQAANVAIQNGYNAEWFSSKALNKLTGDFYKAMARGSLALWDVAETLSAIDSAIADGTFSETDPEITSFSAYCEKVNIDRSNYTKYIKAFREYAELKTYGFSIGVAVALLGTNCPASDFVGNYTPVEMSVRKAQEWAKEYKARVLETSETIETTLTDENTETAEPENENTETAEPKTENTETAEPDYILSESMMNLLLKHIAESALTYGTDDIKELAEHDELITSILMQSATRH